MFLLYGEKTQARCNITSWRYRSTWNIFFSPFQVNSLLFPTLWTAWDSLAHFTRQSCLLASPWVWLMMSASNLSRQRRLKLGYLFSWLLCTIVLSRLTFLHYPKPEFLPLGFLFSCFAFHPFTHKRANDASFILSRGLHYLVIPHTFVRAIFKIFLY